MGVDVKGIVRRKRAADVVEEMGAEAIIIKNFNVEAYLQAFDGCDGVLHMIGIVNERYATFQDVNVHGTCIVLESAYKSQVSKFVTPSGLGVDKYGERPWATNDYFLSKREIEMMCQSSPVSCVVFRPSYILGPGDELIPNIVESISQGTVLVVDTGSAPMQPIFVEDAATAFIRAVLGHGRRHSIYDLVGPETITFMDLIPRVAKIMEEEGFNVPNYKIHKVLVKKASEALGISREEIDVMLCDVLGDFIPFTQDFQITLTPLDEAIHAAVQHAKGEGV
jgi:NADH dehydrogenase